MKREKERKEKTKDFMLKIAEYKIKTYRLKDTPSEYVKKATTPEISMDDIEKCCRIKE